VLEAGCGTGAQTAILADRGPEAEFTSIDVSQRSLAEAARQVQLAGCENVRFLRADIFRLPFQPSCFDHVFVCFVLEHLTDPARALDALMTVLKPGGSLTVIEGDHGSAYFHPASEHARRAIQCLIDLQQQAGGDSLIGRQLYPLLVQAGYRDVQVTPLVAYADGSRPILATGCGSAAAPAFGPSEIVNEPAGLSRQPHQLIPGFRLRHAGISMLVNRAAPTTFSLPSRSCLPQPTRASAGAPTMASPGSHSCPASSPTR
jgi:Methyltransferase domain